MTSERQTGTPTISGDERDGLSWAKRLFRWRPGERKRIKRGYNKRARRAPVDVDVEPFPGTGQTSADALRGDWDALKRDWRYLCDKARPSGEA